MIKKIIKHEFPGEDCKLDPKKAQVLICKTVKQFILENFNDKIFIVRGEANINIVDYRFANDKTVRHFNQIILNNSHSLVLRVKKQLSKMI